MRMSIPFTLGIVAIAIAIQVIVLHLFGQPSVSTSGHLTLFAGDVHSAENSQQFSDWYTFSHIIHGFLFYLALWFFFPRMSFLARLALAVGIEVAWEIAENTPTVINHYREQALALGYTGDSILNSLSDTLAMAAGFHSVCVDFDSKARSSSACGIVNPSAWAVFKLMTNSNRVGCSMGRSPGLAPLRILSTYVAARRNDSAKLGPYDIRPPCSPKTLSPKLVGNRCLAASWTSRVR